MWQKQQQKQSSLLPPLTYLTVCVALASNPQHLHRHCSMVGLPNLGTWESAFYTLYLHLSEQRQQPRCPTLHIFSSTLENVRIMWERVGLRQFVNVGHSQWCCDSAKVRIGDGVKVRQAFENTTVLVSWSVPNNVAIVTFIGGNCIKFSVWSRDDWQFCVAWVKRYYLNIKMFKVKSYKIPIQVTISKLINKTVYHRSTTKWCYLPDCEQDELHLPVLLSASSTSSFSEAPFEALPQKTALPWLDLPGSWSFLVSPSVKLL